MPITLSPWQNPPSPFPTYGPTSTPPVSISGPGSTGPEAGGLGAGAGASIAAGALPGYKGDLASIGANISAETAGKLPADVIQQIQQQAAERGVATGSPGSDNSNAALLRAMGLTSLNLTQQGQQDFSSILGSLPGYTLSQNPGLYTTPGENLSANVSESQRQAGQQGLAEAKLGLGQGLNLGGGGVTLPGARTPGTDALGFPDNSLTITPYGAGGGGATNPLGTTPLGGSLYTGNPLESAGDSVIPGANAPAMSGGDVNSFLDSLTGGMKIDPETRLPVFSTPTGESSDPFAMAGGGGDTSSGE